MIPSENEIAFALMREYYHKGHSPITFRFSGQGIGEADVISITKAGFINEFEIKRTRSDFMADFRNKTYKHKYLAERVGIKKGFNGTVWFLAPSYFWFVVPKNLIGIEDIPEYAGLIYYEEGRLAVIKRAPRTHSEKATIDIVQKIAHNLMCKIIFGGSFMNYSKKLRENEFGV